MNRMKKLKQIREQREKYRRFLAMQEFHYGKSKADLTTPVQDLRKSALLNSMKGCCRQ